MSTPMSASPAESSSPLLRASCDQCRGRKLRCSGVEERTDDPVEGVGGLEQASVMQSGGASCTRCRLKGLSCTFSAKRPMGRPRTSRPSASETPSTTKRRRTGTPSSQPTTARRPDNQRHATGPGRGNPQSSTLPCEYSDSTLPITPYTGVSSSPYCVSPLWTPFSSIDQTPLDSLGYGVGVGDLISGNISMGCNNSRSLDGPTASGETGSIPWTTNFITSEATAGPSTSCQKTEWMKDLQGWLSAASGITDVPDVGAVQDIDLSQPGGKTVPVEKSSSSGMAGSSSSGASVEAVSAGIPTPVSFSLPHPAPIRAENIPGEAIPTTVPPCFCDSSTLFQSLRTHLRCIASQRTAACTDTGLHMDVGSPSTSSTLSFVVERTLLSTQRISATCGSAEQCQQCLLDPSTPIAIASVLNLVSQIHAQYMIVVRDESNKSAWSAGVSISTQPHAMGGRGGIGVGEYEARGSVGVLLGIMAVRLELEGLQRAVRRVLSVLQSKSSTDEWVHGVQTRLEATRRQLDSLLDELKERS